MALAVALSSPSLASADDLAALSRDFWIWRAATQPITRDDLPRADRPHGWAPDWSAAAVEGRRTRLASLTARWQALADARAPTARQVDHRLLGSGLARVRWELDGVASWRRDPGFYVDQTVGAVVDVLLPPPPFDRDRARDLVARLRAATDILTAARANLVSAARTPSGVSGTGWANSSRGIESRASGDVGAVSPPTPARPWASGGAAGR